MSAVEFPCTHCNYVAVSNDYNTSQNMLRNHVRTCPNRARVTHSLNIFTLDDCIYASCQCDAFEVLFPLPYVPWADTKKRLKKLRKWCKAAYEGHSKHVAEMTAS